MLRKQKLIVAMMMLVMLAACGAPAATTSTSNPASTPAEAASSAPTALPPTEAPPAPTATTVATEAPTEEVTEEATEAPTEVATEAPTKAATEGASEETATAQEAATSCAEGMRLFDHELLATPPLCIPAAPQRVISLEMASMEMLLLTNRIPVGTATWMLEEVPLITPQYAEVLSKVEGLGYPAELEKVATLRPDLILAMDDTIDVKLAAEIAPVVIADEAIYGDWKLGMDFWSDVLNVNDLYTEMEANYRTRVDELKTALGTPEDIEVSVISVSTYGMSLWMPDSPPGTILADVGLSRPEAQSLTGDAAMARYGSKQYVELSEERLDLAEGDAIFYFTYAATNPEVAATESAFLKTFNEKPIWKNLNVVKAGKAFFVGGHWWRSQTYLLANMVIDDLFANLTDTKATTPVLTFE